MPHYFLKAIPTRPSFGEDATESELAKMNEHFEYWLELFERGTALIFGPVMDAEGIYGMGVVETEDETVAHALAAEDPAVLGGVIRMTVSSMRVGAARGASAEANHGK